MSITIEHRNLKGYEKLNHIFLISKIEVCLFHVSTIKVLGTMACFLPIRQTGRTQKAHNGMNIKKIRKREEDVGIEQWEGGMGDTINT